MRGCRNCCWRFSNCDHDGEVFGCEFYEPAGFDDDWEPPAEKEYDPGPGADMWGRAGFTVIYIADEAYRECDD